jgi:hypothetical protein
MVRRRVLGRMVTKHRNRNLVWVMLLSEVPAVCQVVDLMDRVDSRVLMWLLRSRLRSRLFLMTGRPSMVQLLVPGRLDGELDVRLDTRDNVQGRQAMIRSRYGVNTCRDENA